MLPTLQIPDLLTHDWLIIRRVCDRFAGVYPLIRYGCPLVTTMRSFPLTASPTIS